MLCVQCYQRSRFGARDDSTLVHVAAACDRGPMDAGGGTAVAIRPEAVDLELDRSRLPDRRCPLLSRCRRAGPFAVDRRRPDHIHRLDPRQDKKLASGRGPELSGAEAEGVANLPNRAPEDVAAPARHADLDLDSGRPERAGPPGLGQERVAHLSTGGGTIPRSSLKRSGYASPSTIRLGPCPDSMEAPLTESSTQATAMTAVAARAKPGTISDGDPKATPASASAAPKAAVPPAERIALRRERSERDVAPHGHSAGTRSSASDTTRSRYQMAPGARASRAEHRGARAWTSSGAHGPGLPRQPAPLPRERA